MCIRDREKSETPKCKKKDKNKKEAEPTTVFAKRIPRLSEQNLKSGSAKTKDGVLYVEITLKEEKKHSIKVES